MSDKALNTQQKLTEEAIFKLSKTFMEENLNCDSISVITNSKKEDEFCIKICVYNLAKERELIDRYLSGKKSDPHQDLYYFNLLSEHKSDKVLYNYVEANPISKLSAEIILLEYSENIGTSTFCKTHNEILSDPDSDTRILRKPGDDISYIGISGSYGTLGGILKNSRTKDSYAITCYHNFIDSNDNEIRARIGSEIISPSHINNRHWPNEINIIGHLFWYKYFDSNLDIALVKLKDNTVDSLGYCGKLKDNFPNSIPKKDDLVKICGRNTENSGIIISNVASKRVRPKSYEFIFNKYEINILATNGDSGALVTNENDEVLGIAYSISFDSTFFHDLDIIKSINDNIDGNNIKFNFLKFN